MNLPNKLTTGRIIMVFVMILVLLYPFQMMPNLVLNGRPIPVVYLFSLIIFILASITDFLDGYLARKLNLITNLGKFLDPLADKLLTNSLLILLMITPVWLIATPMLRVPAWAVIIMITRDLTVDGIRMIAVTEGKVLAANMFGKVKTFFQIFAIIFYLLNDALFASLSLPSGLSIAELTLYIGAFASLLSLVNYVQEGWKFIRHG
jgi:CDP-diacylglycerol---glycerol-3-phosphate 3-phosphatidyltransferase